MTATRMLSVTNEEVVECVCVRVRDLARCSNLLNRAGEGSIAEKESAAVTGGEAK
jgi:hypothetical protein